MTAAHIQSIQSILITHKACTVRSFVILYVCMSNSQNRKQEKCASCIQYSSSINESIFCSLWEVSRSVLDSVLDIRHVVFLCVSDRVVLLSVSAFGCVLCAAGVFWQIWAWLMVLGVFASSRCSGTLWNLYAEPLLAKHNEHTKRTKADHCRRMVCQVIVCMWKHLGSQTLKQNSDCLFSY